MNNLCPLLFVFFLIYWSCSDTIPPTVSIISHTSGKNVNKIVPIKVTTQDNEEISKVEFFIDDSLVLTDTEIPYEGYWNTSQYEDGSKHIAKVISYDISDNSTVSQPLPLIIDNSDFYLTPSVLYPITYKDGYQISWSQNNDDIFGSYKLYESKYEDMRNWTLLYETNNRKNTTFILTLEVLKYYQIVVEDIWDLQSTSNIVIGDYYLELWGNYYSILNTDSLDLPYNDLTGSIPPEIGNLTNLYSLYLNNNQLTGEIPSEIGNLTNLNYLYLSHNKMTGEIPENICDLNIGWSNMIHFNIYNNLLCPTYPSCIEAYVGKQVMTNCD